MSNRRGTLDAGERARESVERGAVLPESSMAKLSGDYGRSPVSTGYESERAFAVRGRVVGEAEFHANAAHPGCAVCREIFMRGWSHAMHGWAPSPEWFPRASGFAAEGMIRPSANSQVELEGYDTYRRVRGINEEQR